MHQNICCKNNAKIIQPGPGRVNMNRVFRKKFTKFQNDIKPWPKE